MGRNCPKGLPRRSHRRLILGVLLSTGVAGAALAACPAAWAGPAAPAFSAVPFSMGEPIQILNRPDPGDGDGEPYDKPYGDQHAVPTFERKVYELTNQERAKVKCPQLRLDDALAQAARNHSREMAAYGYLSHTSQNDEDPSSRMARSGYPIQHGWAENIAFGAHTPEAVMNQWMNSSGHRKNILNCKFRALGVGVAQAHDGTLYWTQNFGGK